MSEYFLFGDKRFVESVQFYRVRHDITLWRFNFPEVFRLNPDHHVVLTKEIQWLIKNMKPTLTKEQFTAVLDKKTAFANGTCGFPGRRNYITGEGEGESDPCFDQARVCGGAILRGTESGGSLVIDAIDTRKPIPTAGYILSRPWLYYEAVNIDSNAAGQGIIRPFKGAWGKPVFMPLLVSKVASYPLILLEKLPMGSPLPSAYRYP